MPTDQREDDAGSLCFEGAPLAAPLQILGGAEVEVELSSDWPEGLLAVRLSDGAPDGAAARITYGLLNLQHRDGQERAVPLAPGAHYRVTVRLKDVGYEVAAGHRLRIALSTAYWPLTMPGPRAATLIIYGGELRLPLRQAEGPAPAVLGVAWTPPPLEAHVLVPPARGRMRVERRVEDGRTTVEVVRNLGALQIAETDLELQALGAERYSILPDDPATAVSEAERRAEFKRDGWHAVVTTRSELAAEDENWRFLAALEAHDGAVCIFARQWDLLIPRSTAGRPPGDRPDRSASTIVPEPQISKTPTSKT
jgi:hypothetical protein